MDNQPQQQAFNEKLRKYTPILLLILCIALILNLVIFVAYVKQLNEVNELLRACNPSAICNPIDIGIG